MFVQSGMKANCAVLQHMKKYLLEVAPPGSNPVGLVHLDLEQLVAGDESG